MSSNEATRSLLSDVAGGLRDQLRQGQEANRQQAVLVDQLRAEVAGLKRGLSAAKRDLRRSRDEAARLKAEVTAIVEAMERLNRPEAK
jgi:outer membrane murein-binding lipoprotein Lpp